MSPSAPCPCGSGTPYAACCRPRHDGTRPAETAEALMRSRYAAYVRGDGRYLAATSAGGGDPAELSRWAKSVAWLGLEVTGREQGGPTDATGVVAFTARYLEEGAEVALFERSRFARGDGRWLYLEGDPQVTRRPVERNQRCPCGSGKKFKSCHA